MQTRFAIVGAGMAGLAAALVARRLQWQVDVFERSPALQEVGAGIQLGPNATRILRAWGLDAALAPLAVRPKAVEAWCAERGERLATLDLAALAARHGAPYLSIHRADLQQVLAQAAQSAGAQLHLGQSVQALHLQPQAVQLDTRAESYAAVAVADGVWSPLRAQVLSPEAQDQTPLRWSGHVAYRALLPMSSVPASWRLQTVQVWMAPRLHAVVYPIRAGECLNVVVLVAHQAASNLGQDRGWDALADPEAVQADLAHALRGTHAQIQSLREAVPEWRVWPLMSRVPVAGAHHWGQGARAVLLGDAAHPMLPYLAQGAGMAIEDAHVLGQTMREASVAQWPLRLQAFARARNDRVARVQRTAARNGEVFHATGGVRWGRDWALRLAGERLMEARWLYGERHGL